MNPLKLEEATTSFFPSKISCKPCDGPCLVQNEVQLSQSNPGFTPETAKKQQQK